ncbi:MULTISPECIES: coproporphyrinogen III oxidase [Empedobacter]|uniref:coproporphyrinogen III oxidase n=1 Tax=Empedobacter TaxID=59734 RepID=UPI002574C7D8|nr:MULTISPECIES: coproporphyrinogen III oxidase [Empedobacter]MDM1042596.1 coproporphyrinogen III oxidase [Empedobacter brevis]MDM1136526.1 coproporphyrinogen III oxidase [Empedobacter sp. R750]
MKDQFFQYIQDLQNKIIAKLEEVDGKAKFLRDNWEREEGGGGLSCVLTDGAVFEKAGVNISKVYGELPETMQKALNVSSGKFFACGLSLVIHPTSPHIPTTHANYWHMICKKSCDAHDAAFYPKYKEECDKYFWNTHRGEARGIGGLFFDYLKPTPEKTVEQWYDFVTEVGNSFLEAYIPIVEKHKNDEFSAEQKEWQEIRRGRYVEFNLIHDRGTLFGLKTNGRIESILMSLPKHVQWHYNHQPEEGSEEYKLVDVLKHPKDWI